MILGTLEKNQSTAIETGAGPKVSLPEIGVYRLKGRILILVHYSSPKVNEETAPRVFVSIGMWYLDQQT